MRVKTLTTVQGAHLRRKALTAMGNVCGTKAESLPAVLPVLPQNAEDRETETEEGCKTATSGKTDTSGKQEFHGVLPTVEATTPKGEEETTLSQEEDTKKKENKFAACEHLKQVAWNCVNCCVECFFSCLCG